MRRLLPLIFALAALPAAAQKPADLQPLPDLPPPPVATPDNVPEPTVTITTRGQDRVEEYRINNKLYMMKVTPAHGGTPYYLIDERGDGAWVRHDLTDPGLRVPMWVIGHF